MLIFEYKLDGSQKQYTAIEEAIRIVQFIRNKCLRLWMDERGGKASPRMTCSAIVRYSPKTIPWLLVSSHDVIAYEDLQIHNVVRNHHLAKSIQDAAWGTFISRVKAYGVTHDVPIIAVAPQFTSQEWSACGALVKKSPSVRTHICTSCGVVLDRDHNAARNILAKAFACTLGHRETSGSPESASGQTASTRLSPRKTSKRAG